MGFGAGTTAWGIFDAIRAVRIEEHVVNTMVSLVNNARLEDQVDLVEGVRTILFFTSEEEAGARDEYEAAKAAGINVSAVEWFSEGEVEKVRQFFSSSSRQSYHDSYLCRHTERDIRQCASQATQYGPSSLSLSYSNLLRTPHRLYP
jgi:hypothetical protein